MRRVTAYWWMGTDKVRIGELAQGRATPIVFEWDRDFLNSTIELSPIRFSKQPGLLEGPREPFGGLHGLCGPCAGRMGRILIRRGLGRLGIDYDDISPLDMLQYIGERGMGALSFEPSLRSGEKWAEGKIDLTALEKGVEPILSGTPSDVLDEFLEGGSSPNGIRPKIIAKEHKGKLYVGSNSLPADEWLIKFRAPEDPKEIGKLEYIYWLMAKEAGLKVSESKLFKSGKDHYFGTKRFDRKSRSRLHLHTLSGLLGVSPLNFAVGYEHFAKAALALTSDRRSQEEVLRIALFNVLVCNQDDHSRNVSFLMDKDGKWEVAPAYDLNFHRNRSDEHKMGINGKGKLIIDDLKAFGFELGIGKGKIGSTLEEVKDAVNCFKKHAKSVELSKGEVTRINSALQNKLQAEVGTRKLRPKL